MSSAGAGRRVHLAGPVVDADVAVLADGSRLLWVCQGGASVRGVELGVLLVLLGVSHLSNGWLGPKGEGTPGFPVQEREEACYRRPYCDEEDRFRSKTAP